MRILEIKVKNFRCLKKAETTFDKLTVFIGRNGSGKSSLLHAILVFFTLNARIKNEDFFNKNTLDPIEIEITFEDLTTEEKTIFGRYMENDKLVVLKTITYDEARCQPFEKYFSYMQQIPEFAEIRKIVGAKNKTDALKGLKTKFADLENPRSEAQTLEIMQQYESKHPELLKKLQVEGTFLGARNVGGGSLDNYTKLLFLPAVKEASDEVQGKGSSINQLLDAVVLQKIQNREDLLNFKNEISDKIREKYSPDNLGGLEDVSRTITETLNRYAPGSRLSLVWNPMQIPEVTLPSVSTTVFEDEFGGDISNKGHGLQRALILTLLEYLALTLAAVKTAPEKVEGAIEKVKKPIRIDTILLIEEPEIYLHPTRARYLSKVLFDLASAGTGGDVWTSCAQVVYTTHSPYFVGLDRFDSLRLCKKKRNGEAAFTEIIWNTLEAAAKRYEEICGRAVEKVVRDNFKVRTSNIMSQITNEGFFADLVVLVEGLSDVGLIWKLQEKTGKNWDKIALSVIPAEGKEHIIRLKIILDGLKISNYTIFDKEVQTPRANKRLLKLMGEASEDLPQEKVHDTWAYNNLNLEEELKKALTIEKYEEIWRQIQTELGCTDRIRKNIEANARFAEIVCDQGIRLPHFEAIIQKINSLYEQVKI
jgi:predicted ATP-dependent endonuclease of OLD family